LDLQPQTKEGAKTMNIDSCLTISIMALLGSISGRLSYELISHTQRNYLVFAMLLGALAITFGRSTRLGIAIYAIVALAAIPYVLVHAHAVSALALCAYVAFFAACALSGRRTNSFMAQVSLRKLPNWLFDMNR
jgi:hypothetical protein